MSPKDSENQNLNTKLLDLLEKNASKLKAEIPIDVQDNINLKQTESLIERFATEKKVDFFTALVGVSELYQKGSHLGCVEDRQVNIDGTIFTKKDLNNLIKTLEISLTHRCIARSMKEIILVCSRKRNIPGHLYKQYKKYLTLNEIKLTEETLVEHSYYCSDFQLNSPTIPKEVFLFLVNRTRAR